LAAERRTLAVIVYVVVGPLVLVLGVVRLRRRLQVRPPVADGGGPAFRASPEVWAPIEQAALAAVQADPAGPDASCPALGRGWPDTDPCRPLASPNHDGERHARLHAGF
jgi:hypothetical protein